MLPNPTWKVCDGEAHSNPFIDSCWGCMPWWHYYPVCAEGHTMEGTNNLAKLYCKKCKRYYNWTDKPR